MQQGQQRSIGRAIRRALCGRCPNCGRGRLYATYLRQVEACAVCGEGWGEVRADDAPPWLTILIVGHVMAPLVLAMVRHSDLPDWAMSLILVGVALGLCLLVLPRAKAVFIAAIWASRARSS